MFIFIMIIVCACVGLYNLFINFYDEKENKRKAINNNQSYYINRYNQTVDVNTDVPYTYKSVRTKPNYATQKVEYTDYVKVSALTGSVIENYTQEQMIKNAEKRAKAKQEAINNGEHYYIYDFRQKWPGIQNKKLFEMQLKDARTIFPNAKYIWADVITEKKYFVAELTEFYKKIKAHVLVGVTDKSDTIILDYDLYTPDELDSIKNLMRKDNWYEFSCEYYIDELHLTKKEDI